MATATTSAVILPFLLLLSHVLATGATVRADAIDEIGPDSAWIVEPPDTGVAVRGKPYTIKCHSNLPNVTYRWTFNDQPLDLVKDSRRRILPDGSLHFNKVTKKSSDAGSYRCIVQTPYGAISSKTFTLLLAEFHDFDESPIGTTVHSEASRSVIRFTCHINSIPEATIMWQKNENPLPANNRFITEVPGVLYIKQVNENDAGSYRCAAKNNLLNKTKFSKVAHLNVEKKNDNVSSGSQSNIHPLAFISPATLSPSVKYVTEGDNVTFECAATGVPSPQLNWSFTTSTGNKQNILLSDKDTYVSILSLTRVTINSSGVYTCHAFQPMTGWPDFPHAQVFQLEVMTLPTLTIRPETQSVPLANSIRLKCGAQGNPIPNITWFHNGHCLKTVIGRVKVIDKQVLLLGNTVSNDSGIYQCFASNQHGTTWAGALITISSSPYAPAPPTNISCRTLSPTEIQLFWQKSSKDNPDNPPIHVREDSSPLIPSLNGDPLSSSTTRSTNTKNTNTKNIFTIHSMRTDGGDEKQCITFDNNNSIVIGQLEPFKNYSFYVRVWNGKSGSDQSEKVTCKTQDEAPQTVPDLVVTPLSPVSLHVKWSAINDNSAFFGEITQYQVMWRRFCSASYYIQVLHKKAKQYTITGLKPGGQYEVQVLGGVQNELSDIDFSWYFVELPAIDPILPTPVLEYDISQSTIKLSWSVDESIEFKFYKLMYRVTSLTNQSLMSLQTFKPDIKSYSIQYTSDMDVYEVLLNCVSENKEGESVTKTIAVLLEMFSPPSQIEAVATSLHTVNVSWVSPDSVDQSSLVFIITYNPTSNISQNVTSTTVFTELGVSSYELSGLKPYSLYEIKISVQDKTNRKSEFSQKVQIRTLQGVPGIVEQIEWHWMNTSTVRINWVEPIKPNGVILGYYLSYTSELNIPPTTWQQRNVSGHMNSLDISDLSNNTHYFFMLRAATDVGFGPQSGIFSIKPIATSYTTDNPKQPVEPAFYVEEEQLLGIVIGCVIGVCCILICTTSIMLKRQCMKNEQMRNSQRNTLGSHMTYCASNLRPFTVGHVQHEESVPLNDISYITRHLNEGRGRYSNNISGMAELPLLDHSNGRDLDMTNIHIIENPQCTVDVDVDSYDVDSLLSESAEGGAGTEESGCSDRLAKSQKGGDSSVADDGFHEHLEPNKILVE